MKVDSYICNKKFPHDAEEIMFNEIITSLERCKSNIKIWVIGNIELANTQLDILIIKNNCLIILDMKNYIGKIVGDENGDWFVETEHGKVKIPRNCFQQARTQKFALAKKLQNAVRLGCLVKFEDNPRVFKVCKTWLCFREGSTYDLRQVHSALNWFKVITSKKICKEAINADSNTYHFTEEEIKELIDIFHAERIDIESRTIDTFFDKIELTDLRYKKIEDLYVKPKEFDEIKEKLENERIIFIVRDPEIGKTYTSIKLLLDYYKKGYEPVYYKEIARKEQLEILIYKQEQILEGNKIIYFEDPFGKIRFEDIGSVNRDFRAFIDRLTASQSLIIITSREEIFKMFEKEKEFSEDLTQFVEYLKIVKPSYDPDRLALMLEKGAKVYECEWFKKQVLKNFVSWYAKGKLITPLRIIQFIHSSQHMGNIDALKEEIDKKAAGTKVSFSHEIKAMETSKILFLSFVYFDLSIYRHCPSN